MGDKHKSYMMWIRLGELGRYGPFSSKYLASLPDFPEKATRTLALGRKKGYIDIREVMHQFYY